MTIFRRENSASKKNISSSGEKNRQNPKPFSEQQRSDIREIFEDVYVANRWTIIRMNFIRGIFFGLGTFLGGTIIVAVVVYVLSQVHFLPYTQEIIDTLQKR